MRGQDSCTVGCVCQDAPNVVQVAATSRAPLLVHGFPSIPAPAPSSFVGVLGCLCRPPPRPILELPNARPRLRLRRHPWVSSPPVSVMQTLARAFHAWADGLLCLGLRWHRASAGRP